MGKPKRASESAGSATLDEFIPAVLALKKEGMTIGDIDWMRANYCGIPNALSLVDFIREQREMSEANPYALPYGSVLERFRKANEEEGWGFKYRDIKRLIDTTPDIMTPRPTGDIFPSLRIRFGHGTEGVRETFQRHLRRLIRVLGDNWFGQEDELPSVNLLNGNASHKPTVEWVVIDASAGNCLRRRNNCLPESYGGPNSVADEGLVLAWLYPERLLNKEPFRAMIFEGYRYNGDDTVSLTTATFNRQVELQDQYGFTYVHTRPVILNV